MGYGSTLGDSIQSGELDAGVAHANIVVAASDSLAKIRETADYVCDGTDDDAQIQAAISALPSTGGKIFCAAGHYSLTNTVTLPSNTALVFEPGNLISVPATHTLTRESFRNYHHTAIFTNEDHGTTVVSTTVASGSDPFNFRLTAYSGVVAGDFVLVRSAGGEVAYIEIASIDGSGNVVTVSKFPFTPTAGNTAIVYSFTAGRRDHNIKIVGANINFGVDDPTDEYTYDADGRSRITGSYASTGWSGIWLHKAEDSVIEKCRVVDMVFGHTKTPDGGRVIGILFSDCEDSFMTSCHAQHVGYEGFGLRGYNRRCVVQGCTGMHNKTHLAQMSGWKPDEEWGQPVECRFDGIMGTEWREKTYDTQNDTSNDNIIIHGKNLEGCRKNSIVNCSVDMIEVMEHMDGVVIANNNVRIVLVLNGGADGSVLRNINISNNNIENYLSFNTNTIEIAATTSGTKSVVVQGNVFGSSTHGSSARIQLLIQSSDTPNFTDFVISNNTFDITETACIHLDNQGVGDIKNIVIVGNMLGNGYGVSGKYGVYATATSSGDIDGLVVNDNVFKSYYGLYLNGSVGDINNVIAAGNIVDVSSLFTRLDGNVGPVLLLGNNIKSAPYVIRGTTSGEVLFENNQVGTISGSLLHPTSPANTTIRNNQGYATEASGSSTGTGAEQTIAHGLDITPTMVHISGDASDVNGFQSSAADATNIYITADNGEAYHWEAK